MQITTINAKEVMINKECYGYILNNEFYPNEGAKFSKADLESIINKMGGRIPKWEFKIWSLKGKNLFFIKLKGCSSSKIQIGDIVKFKGLPTIYIIKGIHDSQPEYLTLYVDKLPE